MRVAVALLLVIAGCSTAQPRPTSDAVPGVIPPAQTWIGVLVPESWVPPQEMSLEVDGQAWSITALGGAGVITPTLSDTSSVRLIGVSDCHEYAAFDANPGGAYSIRFADDGSVTVGEQDGALAMGPGLVERPGGPVCRR
jgi:hypothetical protein